MADYEGEVIALAWYINNSYPLLELQSSVGRVFSILSKYEESLNREIAEELSTTMKYLTMLCYGLGLSLEDIANEA
jgi:hypothetical protein